MNARFALGLATMLLVGVATLIGGAAPFGRLALSLGQPRLAALFFDDPAWQGIAALRAGNVSGAAEAFARAPGGDYNAGVALARGGQYAAALEAFDRAIVANPNDQEARSNFDLIKGIYAGTAISADAAFFWVERGEGPKMEAEIGLGGVRATGTGDEVTNTGTSLSAAALDTMGVRRVSKIFDDRFMLANDRWLANLADVPGEYLAARIYEERKRRAAAGRAPPEPEDPR